MSLSLRSALTLPPSLMLPLSLHTGATNANTILTLTLSLPLTSQTLPLTTPGLMGDTSFFKGTFDFQRHFPLAIVMREASASPISLSLCASGGAIR